MRTVRLRRLTATIAAIGAMVALIVGVGPASPAAADDGLTFPTCATDTDVFAGTMDFGPDGYFVFLPSDGSGPCTLDACTEDVEILFEGLLSPLLGVLPTVDDLVEMGLIAPCEPPPPEPFFAACETGADIADGLVSTGAQGWVIFTPWEFFETLDFSLPCTITECTVPADVVDTIPQLDDGMLLPCPDEPPAEPEPAWQPGDGRPPWAVIGGDPSSAPGRRHVTSPRNPVFGVDDDSLPTTG